MRNIKLEEGFIGADNWPTIGLAKVLPDANATHLPADATDEEKEQIMQSWTKVAVLKIHPITNFRVGYIIDDKAQFLKYPIHTLNGMFGMRVGARPIKFFVVAEDLNTSMQLEYIETTSEEDPKYSELPVY